MLDTHFCDDRRGSPSAVARNAAACAAFRAASSPRLQRWRWRAPRCLPARCSGAVHSRLARLLSVQPCSARPGKTGHRLRKTNLPSALGCARTELCRVDLPGRSCEELTQDRCGPPVGGVEPASTRLHRLICSALLWLACRSELVRCCCCCCCCCCGWCLCTAPNYTIHSATKLRYKGYWARLAWAGVLP